MQLRVLMREDHRERKIIQDHCSKDVNRSVFREKPDTQFNFAVNLIVEHVEVKHINPEEKVLRQNAKNNGVMYLVLNGIFDIQSLQFNRA